MPVSVFHHHIYFKELKNGYNYIYPNIYHYCFSAVPDVSSFPLVFFFFFGHEACGILSSPTRDQTHTLFTGRLSLKHRSTREVPSSGIISCPSAFRLQQVFWKWVLWFSLNWKCHYLHIWRICLLDIFKILFHFILGFVVSNEKSPVVSTCSSMCCFSLNAFIFLFLVFNSLPSIWI